ncbi:hypothetical protein [Allosphingosinicella vermicomposti]|uniref:hypothetical protein n=1 Tax=Allosphingosinicella vermicomposti TaxID=614671 RepID=UPI000D0EC572|nr:hypothetical protein [Allosphingosinicella vermicomposti]
MNRLLLATTLAGSAALLGSCVRTAPAGVPLVVSAKRDGEGCLIIIEGERASSERLLEIGRATNKTRAIVIYFKDTPYKCLGGAIFTLQRAGIAFVDAAMADED